MTGDVATAGTAGTDVTRAADGQRETTGPELSAEEGGVASAPAAPGPPPADAQPDAPSEAQQAEGQAADPQPEQEPAGDPPASAAQEGAWPTGKPPAPAPGRTRSGSARGVRGGVRPARGTPAGDTSAAAAGTAAVRRRLARLGAPRGGGANPVLEPLIKTVRATHPKADVRPIERAYEVAARQHAGQVRRSGDPFITHPLAVATILAELGMNSETLCAALLHDTIEDTSYTL
ncbi:MAG TPA: HD domain-containing protein, partial [Streptosporangiaceae bacterium]